MPGPITELLSKLLRGAGNKLTSSARAAKQKEFLRRFNAAKADFSEWDRLPSGSGPFSAPTGGENPALFNVRNEPLHKLDIKWARRAGRLGADHTANGRKIVGQALDGAANKLDGLSDGTKRLVDLLAAGGAGVGAGYAMGHKKEAARGDRAIRALYGLIRESAAEKGISHGVVDAQSRLHNLFSRATTPKDALGFINVDDSQPLLQATVKFLRNPENRGNPILSRLAPVITNKWVNPATREFRYSLPYTVKEGPKFHRTKETAERLIAKWDALVGDRHLSSSALARSKSAAMQSPLQTATGAPPTAGNNVFRSPSNTHVPAQFGNAATGTQPIAQQLAPKLDSNGGSMANQVQAGAQAQSTPMTPTFDAPLQKMASHTKSAAHEKFASMGPLQIAALDEMEKAAFADWLRQGGQMLGGAISNGVNNIRQGAQNMWQGAKDAVGGMYHRIGDTAHQWGNRAATGFQNATNNLAGGMRHFSGQVADGLQGMAGGVRNAGNNAAGFTQFAGQQVSNGVRDMGNATHDAYANFGNMISPTSAPAQQAPSVAPGQMPTQAQLDMAPRANPVPEQFAAPLQQQQAPPQPAAPQPSAPSQQQLAQFQRGTASAFDPNSAMDRAKMDAMMGGNQGWASVNHRGYQPTGHYKMAGVGRFLKPLAMIGGGAGLGAAVASPIAHTAGNIQGTVEGIGKGLSTGTRYGFDQGSQSALEYARNQLPQNFWERLKALFSGYEIPDEKLPQTEGVQRAIRAGDAIHGLSRDLSPYAMFHAAANN